MIGAEELSALRLKRKHARHALKARLKCRRVLVRTTEWNRHRRRSDPARYRARLKNQGGKKAARTSRTHQTHQPHRQEESSVNNMKALFAALTLIAALTLAIALTGCGTLGDPGATAKNAGRTINDVAGILCELFAVDASEEVLGGLTVGAYCGIHKNLKPFLDEALAAQQAAALRVSREDG